MRYRLVVFYLCVFISGLLASVPISASAQSEDKEPLEVKEVVVSSTRLPDTPVDVRTLPAKVTIITADDIKKTGAKTVQEAIQWATGIVMYDSVGNAFQQTIDMRGFNGQPVTHTAVLVDGIRMNEPDFNSVNFDLIPIETIERIEIIPGPGFIYGKNSMAGVINILSKRGGERHLAKGEALFGSFNRQRYEVNASGPIGKLDYFASFGHEAEDGFRDASDGKIARFMGRLGFRPSSDTDLNISYTFVDNRLMQAGQISVAQAALDRTANTSPGDFVENETSVVRLNGRQTLPLGFSLSGNAFYRHLAQDSLIVYPFGRSDQLLKTQSEGGTLQLTHETVIFGQRNILVFGSEFTRNDFSQRSIAGSRNSSVDEHIAGVYAQDTLSLLDRLVLITGVRYDHDQYSFADSMNPGNNASLHFTGLTPRAGLTYLPRPNTSIYFNYSQGFRNPLPVEVFATQVGELQFATNTALQPVRSHNYELGAKQKFGQWAEASVALFHSDIKDDVVFGCIICRFGVFQGQNINIPKSRRRGFEGTLKVRSERIADATLNYTYVESESRSQFVNSNSGQTVDVGDTLPLVPKHRLSFIGNLRPANGWTLSLMGLYVSTQVTLFDEGNQFPRLPGYFQLNSRVAYERPVPGGRLMGFVQINNMLDQKYSSYGSSFGSDPNSRFVMPAPGIAVYGGLSYRFEGLSQ